jgi:hypothetical protein
VNDDHWHHSIHIMRNDRLIAALLTMVFSAMLCAHENDGLKSFSTPDADMKGEWDFEHDPALPDVLILGDSISISYTLKVREKLRGKANVFRPMQADGKRPDNCGDTTIGLAHLNTWVGDRKWKVIHFNWGLWDLCYRWRYSQEQGRRDKVNGSLTTTLAQYEKNLEKLVARLESTGAKLVWANITVVPEGEAGRIAGDELKYNAVAQRVMKRHGIAMNDLHSISKDFPQDHFSGPGDVHFSSIGCAKLATQVAGEIDKLLD